MQNKLKLFSNLNQITLYNYNQNKQQKQQNTKFRESKKISILEKWAKDINQKDIHYKNCVKFIHYKQMDRLFLQLDSLSNKKNRALTQKRDQLKSQLLRVRKQTNKIIKQMNQAVRDRLAKKQKLVMDKSSRPTEQDIKSLTELFEYMQKQGQIIDRNNKDIDKVIVMKQEHLKKLKIPQENHMQKIFDQMDKEYIRLNEQCSKQTTKLSAKSADLSSFKQRIVNIQADIEQSRVAYQSVESAVRQKQRQLDHLTTYFRNRTREDQDNIDRQRKLSTLLEAQLLKAQKIVNFSKNTNEQLKITQAEFLTSKSKQI